MVCDEGEKIVLEKTARGVVVPLLPHDSKGNPTTEDQVLPKPGKDRSLVDAANDFRRVLPANGEIDVSEDCLDRSEQIRNQNH